MVFGARPLRGLAVQGAPPRAQRATEASTDAGVEHRLGRFAPVLTTALQGGPEEFAAKSYVLSQVDPEFTELQRKLCVIFKWNHGNAEDVRVADYH